MGREARGRLTDFSNAVHDEFQAKFKLYFLDLAKYFLEPTRNLTKRDEGDVKKCPNAMLKNLDELDSAIRAVG